MGTWARREPSPSCCFVKSARVRSEQLSARQEPEGFHYVLACQRGLCTPSTVKHQTPAGPKLVPQLVLHVLGPALTHKHKRLSLCAFATSSPASHCFLLLTCLLKTCFFFVAQLVHLKSKFLHFNSFHVYLKLGRYRMLLLVPKKGKNTS